MQMTKISKEFLLSKGWKVKEEKPLHITFEHSTNSLLSCTLGSYGGFCIAEKHWLNDANERIFATTNPKLTEQDYMTIIDLLGID